MSYILRGITRDGDVVFYTGGAGDRWLTPNKAEAFRYSTLSTAQNRALRFNEMEPVHGVRFLAGPPSQFKATGE